MLRNKRLLAAAVLAAVIAGVFWSQSRIPALNEKAQMGLRTSFGEIAFDVVLPVTPAQSLPERVFRSSVNWAYTNKQGMTFGMLFAAAVLTLLGNVRRRQFDKPWLNSMMGVLIGAPLGVCVNCATPIAFGIYSAGARLETALASLVASPTLNVIVLTMAFTLLPTELAFAKLAGVLVMIAMVPFLVRQFAGAPDLAAANAMASRPASRLPIVDSPQLPPENESLIDACLQAMKQFAANLWFLIRFALPLMLLAGVLGSIAIEVVPFDTFAGDEAALGTIAIAALAGAFLPVPIAFDVIVVMALLSSGVDVGVATALLFALGIYSIYPAAMIGRYVSVRLSMAIGATVVLLAILLGAGMQTVFANKTSSQADAINSGLAQSAATLVSESAGVCDALPETLQAACFVRKIDAFEKVIAADQICDYRPAALDEARCLSEVTRLSVTREAIRQLATAPCSELDDVAARSRCIYSVTLRQAQKNYDVGRCDVLPNSELIAGCRAEYLNASLLFNPDESACTGLTGAERDDCLTNAAIYRSADTLDLAACDVLEPAEARDHCRYTIASTMIGRHNDPTGCDSIVSDTLAARCDALVTAWQAENEGSVERCNEIDVMDLRNACLLRTTGKSIDRILSRSMLASLPAPADRLDPDYATPSAPTTSAPARAWTEIRANETVTVSFSPYVGMQNNTGTFDAVAAAEYGIDDHWQFAITDFFEPFLIGKGVASGDFNGDTWPDVVLATSAGIRLFRNIGGRFASLPVDQGALASANIFLVALVDVDGDGNQDVFASAYGGRNFVLRNLDGEFLRTALDVIEGEHRLTLSAGFADLDLNGEIDVVLGNWSSGLEKLFATGQSGNTVLMQAGGQLQPIQIDEVKGETNSVLIADINSDGIPDILFGNDRLVPDLYYLGDGEGGFTLLNGADGKIPVTSMFTMSLEAADFNNDLRVDLFSTDMTFARSSRDDYCSSIDDADIAERCRTLLAAYESLSGSGPSSCEELAATSDRQACYVAFAIKAARDLQDSGFCDALPSGSDAALSLCYYLASPADEEAPVNQDLYLAQTQRNTLLINNGTGFDEQAEAAGVASSFWSWNAKAADLDNDGWQDIYIGNGFHFGENFYEIQSNIMFRNQAGSGFDEVQSQWGLDDPINTPSYTYLDVDLDGDLDIIATGVLSPPRVLTNGLSDNQSLTVELRDQSGNTDAIGATVVIRYGGGSGQRQMRTITQSGGFLSFNHAVAHFGVAGHDEIDGISVSWPDGRETTINGPLPAGGTYRIQVIDTAL